MANSNQLLRHARLPDGLFVYGAIFGLAFIIGPAAAGALIGYGVGFPFFIAAGLELTNVMLSQHFLPNQQIKAKTSIRSSLRAVTAPRVRRLLICHFLFIFAVICFLGNFALYVERVVRPVQASTASWLLASAGAVGGFALLVLVTPLVKSFGERRVALLGLALSFAGYVLLAVVQGMAVFGTVLILWAVGSAMTQPTLTALLSEYADRREMGAIMGITDAIYSLAMMLGPIVGSAIVGTNARLLGIIPGCAVATAFALVRGRGGVNGRAIPVEGTP